MLAHYIEEEGVPTACISLTRPYTEKVRPPRSLWTSFDLGVPLGSNDPAFQKRVLLALLKLIEAPREKGPVLIEDYPEDAPETGDDALVALSCPVYYGKSEDESGEIDPLHTAFLQEIKSMRSWYDISLTKRNRTTVGVSRIDLDAIGDFLYSFTTGAMPENPRQDVDLSTTLKAAVEDLRAYYFESATSQPGQENVSNKALLNWFRRDTVAGKVLMKVREQCLKSPDEKVKMLANLFIVPRTLLN